jgi:hypothetical protein
LEDRGYRQFRRFGSLSDLQFDVVDRTSVDESDEGIGRDRVGPSRSHHLESLQNAGEEEEQLILRETLKCFAKILSTKIGILNERKRP